MPIDIEKYDFIDKMRFIPNYRNIVLDIVIGMYQETRSENDFEMICDIYKPLQYEQSWFEDYGFLFGYNREDFHQEFMACFVKACNKYRTAPGHRLNSYFYGVLKKTMVNLLKRKAVGFRNIKVLCPLCNEMVAPLSTHLLKKHLELTDDLFTSMGKKVADVIECPLCPSHHRKVTFKNEEHRRRHTMSRHSSQVFSMFLRRFPGHDTALNDPAPTCGALRSGSDSSVEKNILIDETNAISASTIGAIPGDGEGLALLMAGGVLSPCQVSIAEHFLYEDIKNPRLPSFEGLCEVCRSSRNTDECPRGDFKLTRAIYKDEMRKLGEMLVSLLDEN